MMPHLEFSILLALLLSASLAMLGNRRTRDRLCVAAYTFVCCALATFAGSWTMYFIHG